MRSSALFQFGQNGAPGCPDHLGPCRGLVVWVCKLQQGGDVMFNAKFVSADNVEEVGVVFEGDSPSLECGGN